MTDSGRIQAVARLAATSSYPSEVGLFASITDIDAQWNGVTASW